MQYHQLNMCKSWNYGIELRRMLEILRCQKLEASSPEEYAKYLDHSKIRDFLQDWYDKMSFLELLNSRRSTTGQVLLHR